MQRLRVTAARLNGNVVNIIGVQGTFIRWNWLCQHSRTNRVLIRSELSAHCNETETEQFQNSVATVFFVTVSFQCADIFREIGNAGVLIVRFYYDLCLLAFSVALLTLHLTR